MHNLTAINALGQATASVITFTGLQITECPDWALASVTARHGHEETIAGLLRSGMGIDALPEAGTSISEGVFTVLWIGPDQWMIEAPHATHEELAAQIKATVGDAGSVTEQTDGWVRFDLQGERCADVLERLCNADVRGGMPLGSITRTAVEHLGCFLVCRAAGTHFSVIGPRSSARSLHHALVTAAKSAL